MRRKFFRGLGIVLMVSALSACGSNTTSTNTTTAAAIESTAEESTAEETTAEAQETAAETQAITNLDQIDNTKWQYNEEDDVYYQIGIVYCENPADESYENLAIFVPGAYMNATDNGDGTYSCEINETAQVGNYTASTAPIVIPVNTPGYSAQAALTEYSSFTDYTEQGFIYVHAGCRGRDAGAPAGVTDLKAAIRYIRYNQGNIAGDTEKVFSFGMSGGGAQSALLGVTGDSELYDDYLNAIGAVQNVSDAVYGSMAWCPITSLDTADEAYEWNMGTSRTDLTEEEQQISTALTEAYANYINSIGLTNDEGNVLILEQSEDGLWQAGSYYEYIKAQIEESLNNFLETTSFPYDSDSSSQGHQAGMGPDGGNGGMGGHGGPNGQGMPSGNKPGEASEGQDSADSTQDLDNVDFTAIDDIARSDNSSGISISGTYETVQDYIDALNTNGEWVIYDEANNTATITSIHDFAEAVKTASKGLGAFDQTDGSQGENTLFGYGDGEGAHFDATLAEILSEIGSDASDDYAEDLEKEDAQGHTVDYRLNMYSPMYYLLEGSEGYGSSNVAKYFRIRTGIWQSDTSVTTEMNLAQALTNYGSDVDFAAIWGQEHTTAEESGSSTENFIAWVNECMAEG